mmetsp:Transcript_20996/g.19133  ORF Transcript_20996/g.19133 Transcript_20996/m.19133 type:complete len:384 (+) Transcript_20996:51-1202(+)
MSSNLIKKKVIIIGNGLAGSRLAAKLAKNTNLDIIVITPFDFIEIPLRMTKLIATGLNDYNKNIYPLIQEDNVEYKIDVVTNLSSSSVTLKSGSIINYDIAIIATGMNFPIFLPNPFDNQLDNRKNEINNINKRIIEVNTIIISGAGPVGSELAADIKLRNQNKRVVLVSSNDVILDKMSPALSRIGTKKIQEQGVELVLSDHVVSFEDGKALLKSGKTIFADLHIPAHSIGPNSSFMPSNTLDERGFIKVDEYLQVNGLKNVFAVGDVSNRDPIKTATKTPDQVDVIVYNINALITDKPLKKHVFNSSILSSGRGPLLVALGHDISKGYGLGPDLPGCPGNCIWFCCICGPPCSPPAGYNISKSKSDFNNSVRPKKGKGILD